MYSFSFLGWGNAALGEQLRSIDAIASVGTGKSQLGSQGRFPANVIFDEQAAEMLDEQSGILKNGGNNYKGPTGKSVFGNTEVINQTRFSGDSGGASRFFYCAKASTSERNAGCDELPTVNPHEITGRKENSPGQNHPRACIQTGARKNTHPTVKPVKLMEYLCRLITPSGGIVLDPFMGSGTTGIAATNENFKFIGIELNPDYFEIARARVGEK